MMAFSDNSSRQSLIPSYLYSSSSSNNLLLNKLTTTAAAASAFSCPSAEQVDSPAKSRGRHKMEKLGVQFVWDINQTLGVQFLGDINQTLGGLVRADATPICDEVFGARSGDTCLLLKVLVCQRLNSIPYINPNLNCAALFVGQWLCVEGSA